MTTPTDEEVIDGSCKSCSNGLKQSLLLRSVAVRRSTEEQRTVPFWKFNSINSILFGKDLDDFKEALEPCDLNALNHRINGRQEESTRFGDDTEDEA